jgi:alkylation response protein AidB-like acyl-CoA dehydrogenase
MIPEEYGGLGECLLTYALVVEELSRGWMSLSGSSHAGRTSPVW